MKPDPKRRKRPAPVEPLPDEIGVPRRQVPDQPREDMGEIIKRAGFVPLQHALRHVRPVVRWNGVDYG